MALRALPFLSMLAVSTVASPFAHHLKRNELDYLAASQDIVAAQFTTSATYTFSGSSLPEGLYASEYHVHDAAAPYNHDFLKSNVVVQDGFLELRVPGGQGTGTTLTGGEIGTAVSNILYGSVRTTAIFGAEPGACNSMFFYLDDTQETDIEWLSDSSSLSNPGDGSRPVHYTNQALSGIVADKTTGTGPLPADATLNAHEYRIDWLPGETAFYIDGVLQKRYTTNAPTKPGSWLWNNWGNGDRGWTGAPPIKDNVYKISRIEMFFNVSAPAV